MRSLGKVSHIAKSGNIILKGTTMPRLYSIAFSKNSKKIGRIRDIFGPVSSPYISIKPTKKLREKELFSLVGKDLYGLKK